VFFAALGCYPFLDANARPSFYFQPRRAMRSLLDGVGRVLGMTPSCVLSVKRKTIKANQKCNGKHGEMKETASPLRKMQNKKILDVCWSNKNRCGPEARHQSVALNDRRAKNGRAGEKSSIMDIHFAAHTVNH
jgi:hypothetical protein